MFAHLGMHTTTMQEVEAAEGSEATGEAHPERPTTPQVAVERADRTEMAAHSSTEGEREGDLEREGTTPAKPFNPMAGGASTGSTKFVPPVHPGAGFLAAALGKKPVCAVCVCVRLFCPF